MIDSTNPRILANNIRKLFSKISDIPSVEGNPSGSGYNTLLTKLKIGNIKYKLPKDVTVNPEGEASGALNKLGVGSAIYSVASPVQFTKLAEYSGDGVGYAASDTITLSEAMTNYDILMFDVRYSKTEGLPNGFVSVNNLKNTFTTRSYVYNGGTLFADVVYASDTTLTVLRTTYAYITAVYGIKF